MPGKVQMSAKYVPSYLTRRRRKRAKRSSWAAFELARDTAEGRNILLDIFYRKKVTATGDHDRSRSFNALMRSIVTDEIPHSVPFKGTWENVQKHAMGGCRVMLFARHI